MIPMYSYGWELLSINPLIMMELEKIPWYQRKCRTTQGEPVPNKVMKDVDIGALP